MRWLRALWMRLAGVFGAGGDDITAELESHLEMHVEDNVRAGMSREEARRRALIRLGGVEQTRQAWRERRTLPLVEALLRDLRYSLRQMRRARSFTTVAVLTLAVGIGANVAIFSLVDALFLKPLAVAHPEQLLRVYAKGPSGHYGAGFSYPEFRLLRDHDTSFAALSAEKERPQLHLVTGGDSREIRAEFVSGNYFRLLGIEPRLGRAFLAEEDKVAGRDAVAVISDALWRAHFDADPGIVGRAIRVNDVMFRVVGVTPPGFYGDLTGKPVEIWIPAMMAGATGNGCDDGSYNCALFDTMIGRLAPGEGAARAQAEAASRMVWSATDWPERPSRRQIVLMGVNGEDPDGQADDATQLHLLMGVTASLLFIACANLAGLLVARGVTRRREIAVRVSLGARRARIVRQLLTESLLLACLGGAGGLGVSIGAKQILARFYAMDSEGFPHFYDLSLDWRVLVYSLVLVLITGILFGLVPALRASRQDLVTELRDGGFAEQHTRGWLRHGLIVGQLALSMVLVIASALLIRSAAQVRGGTNFDPGHMLVLRLRPELLHYSPAQMDSLVRRVRERLAATAGVQSVAFMEGGEGLVWNWQSGRDATVSTTGETRTAGRMVRKQDVGEDFFRTLKIPLLAGREFDAGDRPGSPQVAVVNDALARLLWGRGTAVGRSFFADAQRYQVVGVAADVQPRNAIYAPAPHLYLSYWQSNAAREGDLRLAIRVAGSAAGSLGSIRRVIESVDARVPIGEDMPMAEQVNLEYMPVVLAQDVMSFCGVLALGLSAMGLYSIVAFAVRTRTREIGIRMALGARREDVLRLMVRGGAKLTLVGVVTGAVAALLATRLLASLLFGVNATDPVTYFGVVALLFVVAMAACCVPARRAASVDPMEALRSE